MRLFPRRRGGRSGPASRCGVCRHFDADAHRLEKALPGLASLASAMASVRGDDGVCDLHQRFTGARAACVDFDGTARRDLGGAPECRPDKAATITRA